MRHLLVVLGLLVAVPAHAGVHGTFEFAVGPGELVEWIPTAQQPNTWTSTYVDVTPVSFGVGTFLTPRLAVTARCVIGSKRVANDASVWGLFGGASAQYWPTSWFWIGGGVGLDYGGEWPGSRGTTALDLRVGAPLIRTDDVALQLSVEYTPGLYARSDHGDDILLAGVLAFALGVQFL